MNRFWSAVKRTYLQELPIIRLYLILYLIGVFVGAFAAVILKNYFSAQAQLLFYPENSVGFFSSLLQQIICFLFLFFLGLTVVGIPLLPLFPLYKGFSIGLLIALAVVFSGVRGLFFGTLAFFAQNAIYTLLGFFICYSSARLSVVLFDLLKGRGKHGASYRAFLHHIYCFLIILPILSLGALWEWKMVPLFLSLF
ncbi:MAG: stage II sporulation protein M [Clostridia bacterium]|nr:stage II sporulation protein M [Clostridia bacterium]